MAAASFFGAGRDGSAHAAGKDVLPAPEVNLESEKNAKPGETRDVVLASGCFWCTEAVFEQLEGVKDVVSGYAGGAKETANYRAVCDGNTGHAESVRVTYEPAKISYGQLLRVFFATHDPTTKDRQGNDRGSSYRSAIFYTDEAQRAVAEDTIADVNASGLWPGRVVTEVAPAGPFWEAEPEHQDYLQRIPNGYTCHFVRPGWKLPVREAAR